MGKFVVILIFLILLSGEATDQIFIKGNKPNKVYDLSFNKGQAGMFSTEFEREMNAALRKKYQELSDHNGEWKAGEAIHTKRIIMDIQ